MNIGKVMNNPKKEDLDLINPFHNALFMCGLPEVGKSQELAYLQKIDHQQDLVLTLANHINFQGITYTPNKMRVRKEDDIDAYPIPKESRYAWRTFLRLYAYDHPDTKRILIDESEGFSAKKLIALCTDLMNIFPTLFMNNEKRSPLILSGVIYDKYNHIYTASKYLLKHCKVFNINPPCKFCKNKSQFMLNVYNGKKITYKQIDQLGPELQKLVIKRMHRYPVCPYHYLYPNQKRIK